MAAQARGYAFDNDTAQASAQHSALSDLLDAGTRQRIEALIELPGKRCLEVAAGGGSIAHWLADRVGPDGEVVATDLKPQHIAARAGLAVRTHDITSDEPIGRYDLVHARLLLNHLPQRETALRHMVDALQPGGVLLTEDLWHTPELPLVAYGPEPAATLVNRYHALHLRVLFDHGNDRDWSRNALGAFHRAGLTGTEMRVYGSSWRGGSPGCRLLLAGTGQLRPEILALGMTEQELDGVAAGLRNPDLVLTGYLVYLTSGRKP
jgi:SAM-dependent methyltransferase